MDASKQVAANVRAQLGRQTITRKELAARLGHHEVWVGRRLNEQVAFTIDEVIAVAAALGVPVSDLLPEVAA